MKKLVLTQFSRPLLFAHRGVSSIAPENTNAAFLLAKELGIPGIELDIHLCKSGELVIIHDSSLKRTAGGNPDVQVEDLTLAQLRQYDFSANFTPRGGETIKQFEVQRIMTLEELIDLTAPDIYLDIELKTESMSCIPLAQKTAETLNTFVTLEAAAKKNPAFCRFIVSSFNPIVLYHFKKFSNIPTALIYANDSGVPVYLRKGQGRFICHPDILKPSWKDILDNTEPGNPQNAKLPHAHKPSYVWTVDDIQTARCLLERGAQAIISNRPQDILSLIKK